MHLPRPCPACWLLCLLLLLPAAAAAQNPSDSDPPPPLLDLPARDPALFPSGAFNPSELMEPLCRKALAAASCKGQGSFNFVRRNGEVYIFTGFFAAAIQDFYCQVVERRLLLSSTGWGKTRLSVPFQVDGAASCVSAAVGLSMCDRSATVKVCRDQAK